MRVRVQRSKSPRSLAHSAIRIAPAGMIGRRDPLSKAPASLQPESPVRTPKPQNVENLSRGAPQNRSNDPSFHATSTTIPSKIFGRFLSWTWYPDNRGQRKNFPPTDSLNKAARPSGLFHFRREIDATFLYRAPSGPALLPSRSPRPALLLRSPPQPGRNPPVRVLQPQGPALSLHHPARPELLLHPQPAQPPRQKPPYPHPPAPGAKRPRQSASFS